jgi:predicted  nucleic acid-binding Zn-ribbon protein
MVKEQGVYEVNLSSLLENDSLIVSDEEGKYLIDINSLLKKKLHKSKTD